MSEQKLDGVLSQTQLQIKICPSSRRGWSRGENAEAFAQLEEASLRARAAAPVLGQLALAVAAASGPHAKRRAAESLVPHLVERALEDTQILNPVVCQKEGKCYCIHLLEGSSQTIGANNLSSVVADWYQVPCQPSSPPPMECPPGVGEELKAPRRD